jgi:uncharacterized protein
MKIEIVLRDKPSLRSPSVICGLPGAALVGKVAVDHLIEQLPAKHLASIYCDGLVPQILVKEDGTAEMMTNDIYFWKGRDGKPDFLLYTGDSQASTSDDEYLLCDAVVDFVAKEYGAKELVTLGAYVTGSYAADPKVFGATTDTETRNRIQSLGCNLMSGGQISGMNGLLLGIAKIKGIKGCALLGETSGYTIDPKASASILQFLEKLTGVGVDLKKLRDRAADARGMFEAVGASQRSRGAQESRQPETDDKRKIGYIS